MIETLFTYYRIVNEYKKSDEFSRKGKGNKRYEENTLGQLESRNESGIELCVSKD